MKSSFFRLMAVVGSVASVFLVGYFVLALLDRSSSGRLAPEDGYRPDSTEIIDPYEISKNPFKLKDHSGILNTLDLAIMFPNGVRVPSLYPGGCLRFEKMIDEHTATYELLGGSSYASTYGEIAVALQDSNPPDSSRLWHVFVEGPDEGVTALGASVTVTKVRFEGYAETPKAPQPVQSTQPNPQPVATPRPPAAPETNPYVADPEPPQTPAPIERQPPETTPPDPAPPSI